MRLLRITRQLLFALILGFVSGCSKKQSSPSSTTSVWRASNDYGDKPGNGFEMIQDGSKITVNFFLLEPEKPHDFNSGVSIPVQIVDERTHELKCEVKFGESEVSKFVLKLPESFPQDEFVATMIDTEPATIPVEFKFKRVRK